MKFPLISALANLFVAVLFMNGASQPVQGQENDTQVASLIDTYIDLRFDAPADATETLLQQLAKSGVTKMKDLEKALRSSRIRYPDIDKLLGKISTHDVSCLHVDYESKYLLYVPDNVDTEKPVALVVVGHGGNSSMSPRRANAMAYSYIQAYRPLTKTLNAVLVAPASSRGWGQIGNSLILSAISDVQRKLPIDPDMIFVTGQSMGGHLSYRSALNLPDRFGAVSPHSGGYDYVESKAVGNLLNVPGYAIWGVREPYGINKHNRTNSEWAKKHGLNWKFVEKDGGHEIYGDELPTVGKFFGDHPRQLYREQVYLRQSAMKFIETWGVKGWPDHTVYHETKPLRWNMRHWLQVEPRPDLGKPLTVLAKNSGNNRFEIVSDQVRNLSVFLHPEMVDLNKPVTVMVNEQQLFHGKVDSQPGLMFDLAREFDDRGRIFWARVDLQIDTDREVEIPTAN